MPRIKQFEAQYAVKDFWAEVDGQSGRLGLKSNAAIGGVIGVTGQSVGKYRADPSAMKIATIQRLVKRLKPDICVTLRFLGYSDKEITDFCNRKEKG